MADATILTPPTVSALPETAWDGSAAPRRDANNALHVFRYPDVRRVLSERTGGLSQAVNTWTSGTHVNNHVMWGSDDPTHAAIRTIFDGYFKLPALRRDVVPGIEAIAAELVATIIRRHGASGQFELLDEFSYRLTNRVICSMLDIEPRFDEVFAAQLQVANTSPSPLEMPEQPDLWDFYGGLLDARAADPHPERGLADLTAQAWNDGLPTREQAVGALWGFVTAGTDTTATQIASMLVAATTMRGDSGRLLIAELREVPTAAHERFIQEVQRFDPGTVAIPAFAAQEVRFGDHVLRPGELVYGNITNANRDPDVFTDPQRFDRNRQFPRPHLAFAVGPHKCLGAFLAGEEMRVALRVLLEAFPGLQLSHASPPGRVASFIHRYSTAHFTY